MLVLIFVAAAFVVALSLLLLLLLLTTLVVSLETSVMHHVCFESSITLPLLKHMVIIED